MKNIVSNLVQIIGFLLVVLGISFCLTIMVVNGERDKKIENTKKDFVYSLNKSRCEAASNSLAVSEWKMLNEGSESYPSYSCYVMSKGYWMELTSCDIDRLLNQR